LWAEAVWNLASHSCSVIPCGFRPIRCWLRNLLRITRDCSNSNSTLMFRPFAVCTNLSVKKQNENQWCWLYFIHRSSNLQ
jgi:hypothetical protein